MWCMIIETNLVDKGGTILLFSKMLLILAIDGWRRRQWHPTPVLLPGKSHGRRSLVGCSPWGREELDTTERLHIHSSLSCIGEGNGNPLQCSCLENPRDGGAWWAAVYGVTQSRTRLTRLSSSSSIDGWSIPNRHSAFVHSLWCVIYQDPPTPTLGGLLSMPWFLPCQVMVWPLRWSRMWQKAEAWKYLNSSMSVGTCLG